MFAVDRYLAGKISSFGLYDKSVLKILVTR